MDERSEKAFVTVTERETESEQMQKTEYFDFTDLVQDAQNGDQSAFETLYWKSYPFLEREAKKFYTEPADIDDALQETYLRIFQKLDTLKDPRTFLGWAITVCKRTLLNRVEYDERHFGKTELRPETSTEEEQGLDLLPAEEYRRDYDPNSFVDAAHVNDALRDVLNALPEHQQMCILLWSEGYTQREIAEELELPLGTVKSNLNYAKKKMTKVLLRMEKEGTFDYKAVASNPVAAFLYLLERYIEVGCSGCLFRSGREYGHKNGGGRNHTFCRTQIFHRHRSHGHVHHAGYCGCNRHGPRHPDRVEPRPRRAAERGDDSCFSDTAYYERRVHHRPAHREQRTGHKQRCRHDPRPGGHRYRPYPGSCRHPRQRRKYAVHDRRHRDPR